MNLTCFICGISINNNDRKHVYYCAKVHNLDLDRSDIRYKSICHIHNITFTKELLYNDYVANLMSLPDLKKKYGISYRESQFLLEYFDIPHRNLDTANKLNIKQEKYSKTCIDRYGVKNVSSLDNIKAKKASTFLANYGVDNIWKSTEYYIWLHTYMVDTYGKKSLPNRYGKMQDYWDTKDSQEKLNHMLPAHKGYKRYWELLTDEQKSFLIQRRSDSYVRSFISSLESRISRILTELGISFQHQFWVDRKSYDFHISGTKLLIEVNGDFWHGNPDIYKKGDILRHTKDGVLVEDIWEKDLLKLELAKKYGYSVVYMWEKDLNLMTDIDVSEFILEKIREYDNE